MMYGDLGGLMYVITSTNPIIEHFVSSSLDDRFHVWSVKAP
jgi:hypothetical protein